MCQHDAITATKEQAYYKNESIGYATTYRCSRCRTVVLREL